MFATMSNIKSNLFYLLLLTISSTFHSEAMSAETDYDGNWSVSLECGKLSVSGGLYPDGFKKRENWIVKNGVANYKKNDSDSSSTVWDVKIRYINVSLSGDSVRGTAAWQWRLKGEITGDSKLKLDGAMYSNGTKLRDCSGTGSLEVPSPLSLLGKKNYATAEQNKKAQPTPTPPQGNIEPKPLNDKAAPAKVAEAKKPSAPSPVSPVIKSAPEVVQNNQQAVQNNSTNIHNNNTAVQNNNTSNVQSNTNVIQNNTQIVQNNTQVLQNNLNISAGSVNASKEQSTPPPPPVKEVRSNTNQVTSNALDSQKKTSSNEVWVSFDPSISIQQRQFCRIIENFRTELAVSKSTNNEIKVNATYRNLLQSLTSLLPDGKFQGWLMRATRVVQARDGSADVLLQLPCDVLVGSNTCSAEINKFTGIVPEGSRIYTELAKMSIGDFAVTSGQFVYSNENVFDKTRSVASFQYMPAASHCNAKEFKTNPDFFGVSIETLSIIK